MLKRILSGKLQSILVAFGISVAFSTHIAGNPVTAQHFISPPLQTESTQVSSEECRVKCVVGSSNASESNNLFSPQTTSVTNGAGSSSLITAIVLVAFSATLLFLIISRLRYTEKLQPYLCLWRI